MVQGTMRLIETPLKDAYVIEPVVYRDQRGFFLEPYSRRAFAQHGLTYDFVQDNHSFSRDKGVLRGLHFQHPPHAQTKLLRVITGAIYDVIVDLRRSSKAFGRWYGVELSDENLRMLLVPCGFAHGFCTLRDNTHVFYKVDAFYAPEADAGIRWDDPDLGIDWPVSVPILSPKDEQLPWLGDVRLDF